MDAVKLPELKLLAVKVPVSLSPVTVPETELLELSSTLKVFVVIVELSMVSLKVTEILELSVLVPFAGEVEETVGAVVSTENVGKVMEFPVFPARSVTVTVQSE